MITENGTAGINRSEKITGQPRIRRLYENYTKLGRPPELFWSDATEPVGLDAAVFRTSLYRSRRQPREFAQPAWSEDLVECYFGGELPLRELRERPVVGFCGYAAISGVGSCGV